MQLLVFNWFTISETSHRIENNWNKRILLEIYIGYKSWICWIQASSGGSAVHCYGCLPWSLVLEGLCSPQLQFFEGSYSAFLCVILCVTWNVAFVPHIFLAKKNSIFISTFSEPPWVDFLLVCLGAFCQVLGNAESASSVIYQKGDTQRLFCFRLQFQGTLLDFNQL